MTVGKALPAADDFTVGDSNGIDSARLMRSVVHIQGNKIITLYIRIQHAYYPVSIIFYNNNSRFRIISQPSYAHSRHVNY